MPKTRAERRAETVDAIIDAALTEFASRPIDDVTLDDIAARAGFTKGAIYANYSSKAQLLLAVLRRRMQHSGVDYVDIVRDLELDEIASATGQRASRTQHTDLAYFRLVVAVWNAALDDPAIATEYAALRRDHRTRLADSIRRRADDAGITLAVDPIDLAAGLMGMSMTAMLDALIDPDVDVGAIHAALTRTVLNGVVAMNGAETER